VSKRRWTDVAAGPVYAALVVALTWPLALHLTTHLPATGSGCRRDTLLIAWSLAHQSRALVTDPSRLPEANIYHPAAHTLLYGETGFGAVPYFMGPFLPTGNPALAINLTFLGCIALTAWALHLVVVRWTGCLFAGFVAGWTLLTTRWVLWTWMPAAPNYTVLQYLPPIVLLSAPGALGARKSFQLFGLCVLQGLSSVYVAAATLLPLAALALGRAARRASRVAGLRLLGVVALALLVLAGPYAGYLVVRAENPDLAQQTLYHPNPTSRLPWGPSASGMPTGIPVATLALIVIGGAIAIVRARRESAPLRTAWLHGLFWVVAGLVLSLAPLATGWHPKPSAADDRLTHLVYVASVLLRGRGRLGLASLVGLALLAGVAFAESTRGLPTGRTGAAVRMSFAALVAVAAYVCYDGGTGVFSAVSSGPPLPHPYPLQVAIAPGPLTRRLSEGDGPLLELPVGGPVAQAEAMYRSIFHRRPLVNGYHGYWPAGFPERMALACRLPDADALAALHRQTGLETIVVHLGYQAPPRIPFPYRCQMRGLVRDVEQRQRWLSRATADDGDLRLVAVEGTDLVFAVTTR